MQASKPIVSFLTGQRRWRRQADAKHVATRGLLVLCGCLLTAQFASADSQRQSLAEVERIAEAFLKDAGNGTPRAVPLDRRLTLARCDRPLEAFLRDGAQVRTRTVIGVRCAGSQPWKVYVPVNLADVRQVVVLRRSQPRGHQLTADDLELQERDVRRLSSGYATDIGAVAGRRLKHSLPSGRVVTPATIATRVLVRRGQAVTLRAQNDLIQIRVAGKALMDGALGQRIRVQNAASGRIVEGLVRSAELVEVLVP